MRLAKLFLGSHTKSQLINQIKSGCYAVIKVELLPFVEHLWNIRMICLLFLLGVGVCLKGIR